jgi:hypothetical protein
MHGGAVAVQQPRPRQHPSPRINAADGRKARGHSRQIADQGRGCHLGLAEACDDDQRFGPFGS